MESISGFLQLMPVNKFCTFLKWSDPRNSAYLALMRCYGTHWTYLCGCVGFLCVFRMTFVYVLGCSRYMLWIKSLQVSYVLLLFVIWILILDSLIVTHVIVSFNLFWGKLSIDQSLGCIRTMKKHCKYAMNNKKLWNQLLNEIKNALELWAWKWNI